MFFNRDLRVVGRTAKQRILQQNILANADPFSSIFIPSVKGKVAGKDVKSLFLYMIALQKEKYGGTILTIIPDDRIHKRHIKYLLKDFSPEIIQRAIKYATLRCEHPFSCRWIRVYAKNYAELFCAAESEHTKGNSDS
jgi:hypothetical protein